MHKKRMIRIVFFAFTLILIFLAIKSAGAAITTSEYEISQDSIDQRVQLTKYKEVPVIINNKKSDAITAFFSIEGDVASMAKLSSTRLNIPPNSEAGLNVTLLADGLGSYNGSLSITGGITESIPINLVVSETVGIPVEAVSLQIEPLKTRAYVGESLRYKIDVQNLLIGEPENITLYHSIGFVEDGQLSKLNLSFPTEKETLLVDTAVTIFKKYQIPDYARTGEYRLTVKADYMGLSSNSSVRFFVRERLWDYVLFGVLPVKWAVYGGGTTILLYAAYMIYKKRAEKKKRYKGEVDFATLPKPGERSIKLGKIAETTRDVFFELDQLTMHTLIAGSTGGGKTVSAEVVIEEALMKNVNVIVFDPTAQWTGFLRKCTSKKMFLLYPKFGLKKTDARAFNGNVHQVINARQIIDIKKYMIPGEIHVFAVNKLDPKDADILVSNTIREVFHANLPEAPQLKTVVIFDEVHRLLPKFGGSGQGFIQIERGAREFRKWGVGLILISQVLTDFVGETKANINTEIQMRTRDQGDLDRIKNKYGGYMLQSLLKAATGTGMMENAAYNRGNPYFVAFRPLLHEHARLSDEELENYNKYNEMIEDLEYEIDQLKDEGIDIFDLKLELKMALDKVKSGSFNMVDIYIEGLKPRVEENWKKLGKKPKKREIKLVAQEELEREFEKAKEARETYEKKAGITPKAGAPTAAPAQEKPKLATLKLGTTTVNTATELVDVVNTMEQPEIDQYTQGEKNVFAEWIRPVNKEVADKLEKAKTKEEIIIVLEDNPV
jgi:hypothetical protein